MPPLLAYIAAYGVATAAGEAEPTAETLAFGQLLPLALELVSDAAGTARLTGDAVG